MTWKLLIDNNSNQQLLNLTGTTNTVLGEWESKEAFEAEWGKLSKVLGSFKLVDGVLTRDENWVKPSPVATVKFKRDYLASWFKNLPIVNIPDGEGGTVEFKLKDQYSDVAVILLGLIDLGEIDVAKRRLKKLEEDAQVLPEEQRPDALLIQGMCDVMDATTVADVEGFQVVFDDYLQRLNGAIVR